MDLASQNYIGAGIKGAFLAGGTGVHLMKNAHFIDEEIQKINDWNENYDSQGRKKIKPKSNFVKNQQILLI